MPFEGYKPRDENSGYLQVGVVPKVTENADGTLTQHVNVDRMPTGTVVIASMPTGSVSVNNLPAYYNVSGSVSVNNLPAYYNVSGSVSVSSIPPVAVSSMPTGSVMVNNFPSEYNIQFDPNHLSAFGVLEVAELTPVLQGDWAYGLNTQIWQTPIASGTGAVVDVNESRLRVQSGTGATNTSYVLSRRPIRYRAGEGIVYRSTPIFATGQNNSVQLQGMGTIVNNNPYDGYFFGMSGTAYGICHYNRGVPTWYMQSNWNQSTAPDLDPTKGTPVFIKYPYLGFGDIFFYVQEQATGHPQLVHIIRYANTTNATQLSNPVLNFLAYVRNFGNTSNLIMYNGSYGAFISGKRSFVANPKWAADSTKTGVTTEALALSIRNCTTYNGVVNRGLIRVHSVGLGTNTNTYGVVRFKINATVGGVPSFIPVSGSTSDNGVTITNGNSIASIDTAGTTIATGTYIWNMPIGSQGAQLMDVTPFEIFVAPGETLSATIFAANALSANLSINWSEDI